MTTPPPEPRVTVSEELYTLADAAYQENLEATGSKLPCVYALRAAIAVAILHTRREIADYFRRNYDTCEQVKVWLVIDAILGHGKDRGR